MQFIVIVRHAPCSHLSGGVRTGLHSGGILSENKVNKSF